MNLYQVEIKDIKANSDYAGVFFGLAETPNDIINAYRTGSQQITIRLIYNNISTFEPSTSE